MQAPFPISEGVRTPVTHILERQYVPDTHLKVTSR